MYTFIKKANFLSLALSLSAVLLVVLSLIYFTAPAPASAQFVPCDGVNSDSGVACTECHLIEMGNTVLVWLIGVMFIIFGFVAVSAGWGLMTAGGSPEALSNAKSKFTNAFIGLLIVLVAWLLVDTIMRQLLNGGAGNLGDSYSGFGLWSEIECGSMADTRVVITEASSLVSQSSNCTMVFAGPPPVFDCSTQQAACSGTAIVDTSNPTSHRVVCETLVGVADAGTTAVPCDVGPSGDRVLCTSQIAACTDSGGDPTVNTSNPAEYQVECAAAAPTDACDTSQMSSVNLFGFNTTVHNSIAPRLNAINSAWSAAGGNSFYRVYSVGAYNCRRVTGGSNYSVHAYGMAVDINPRDNGYVSPRPATCPTNMPPAFVSMFTSRGFGWGGNWRSVCDAMHFSDAAHEGGSTNIR